VTGVQTCALPILPVVADFTGTPIMRFDVSGFTPITWNAWHSCSSAGGGPGIQGLITWYTDASCTVPYTLSQINEDSFTAIGLPYPYFSEVVYIGKYGDYVLSPTDINMFLLAKEVMDRCIYTIISGTPTDCRPLLTDQA
jgi:hypothetical protein